MPTFLFASIPVVAHSSNPLPFAARLVERGHRVLWYAGRRFHGQIESVGAEPRCYRAAYDFSEVPLDEAFPRLANLSGVRAISSAFADIFVGHAAMRVADLQGILAAEPVDAMLCDELMYGVGLCTELGGPPWATFGDGPLPYFEADTPPFGPALLPMPGPVGRLRNRLVAEGARRVVFRQAQRRYNRIRADLGLPLAHRSVLDESVSPYLHLHGCTPAFEYPRTQLPGHMHWVGALRPDPPRDWTPPTWWPEVTSGDLPVVLVSQGSLRSDVTELLVPAVRDLADENVLVVVTTGAADPGQLSEHLGRDLPENVRLARFIPYDVLMPHLSAFVTNGGYSGVTLALAHGVPLVQAGTTEEKAEIAVRIHWTGVGVRLGRSHPPAGAVRSGVRQVLDDPSYAAAAGLVQREMSEHDAGLEGAQLLEELAETRQPVLRRARAASG
ncbi:MAG TPA: nucleotide disphospho-sugar-binding domain-containing protein [Propionibacteriaceae bacterium]|jgi:UDP:flavonoid glycosyltransferase YjiC (YdhE family)